MGEISKSVWESFSAATNFPTLKENITVQVVVIGGGMTGITLAHLLSENGIDVAVLEARKVGGEPLPTAPGTFIPSSIRRYELGVMGYELWVVGYGL